MHKGIFGGKLLLGVAIVMLCLFCGCGEKTKPVQPPVKLPTGTPTPTPRTEYTEEQKAYLSMEVTLDEAQRAELRNVLEVPVVFQYEECFELEKAWDAYADVDFSACTTENIVKNRVVDADALLAQVKKNNADYLVNGIYAHKYIEYTEEELKYLCDLIANTLNEKMKDPAVEAAYLDHTLSNLKIFQFEDWVSVTFAAVQEEFILAISEKHIATLEAENAREKTIVHECMHMLQIGPCIEVVGINHKAENLAVKSLQNNWFYESSAEFAASRLSGEQLLYQNIMRSMDALMTVTAFEPESMENYNFQLDLSSFYDMFSCNGLISKREIAAAMYALDVFHYEQDEFQKSYETMYDTILASKEKRAIKEKYQPDAYIVFAKKLFYDLGNRTLTLEEAFDMLSLYETVCSNCLFYTDLYRMRPSLAFLERYTGMQDAYFALLAETLGATPEEIRELYNFYHAKEYVVFEGMEKSDLLNYIYGKTEFNKGMTVKEAYELYLREGLPDGV